MERVVIVKVIGGLGNQLFQYATGRAISAKLGYKLYFDLSFYTEERFKKTYRLENLGLKVDSVSFDDIKYLCNKNRIPKVFRVLKRFGFPVYPYYKSTHLTEKEVLTGYPKKPFEIAYYIDGWFQNEQFFKSIEQEIRDLFNADFLLKEYNLDLKRKIEENQSVAIHIRRGDYLNNGYFRNLPLEYYQNAISLIKSKVDNPVFFFFSDDIQWVKENFSSLTDTVFVEHNSNSDSNYSTIGDIEDLMLMRACKHQIIANSTFSWWAAWLNANKNKIVVSPIIWFNSAIAQKKNGML